MMMFAQSSFPELCQRYLTMVYQNVQAHSASVHPKSAMIPETNGEILFESLDKLLHTLMLTDQDVLVDLGSGYGKLVVQAFLSTPIKEAVGIEIQPSLHGLALAVAEQVQQDLPDFYLPYRKLTFLQGSFFDIPFTMASVALINATCFSQSMLLRLGEVINAVPSIHTVLATRPIPSLQRLVFKKSIRVECSWDSAQCYIYGV
jgi:hypothetical protein